MSEQRRAPQGNTKVEDDDIVAVLEAADAEFLSTAEVADELPIGKRATSIRLNDLADEDVIETKQTGVGNVWWLPDEDGPAGPMDVSGRLSMHSGADRERVEAVLNASLLLVLAGALLAIVVTFNSLVPLPVSILTLGPPETVLMLAVGLVLLGGALFVGTSLVVAGRYVGSHVDVDPYLSRFRQ